MEAVRKYIDANSLMSVMALPENFKDRRLEVIVFPMEEQAGKCFWNRGGNTVIGRCSSEYRPVIIRNQGLVNGEINKDEYFYTVNIISKSFYPFIKMLLDIDESDKRFKNDNTKYDFVGISHLLNIRALDFDGQAMTAFSPQTGRIESPVSIIVTLNG